MSFSIVSSGHLCTYMHKKSHTVFCSFGYFLARIGFPHSPFGKESACNARDPGSIPGSGRSLRRDRLPTPVFLGFPCGPAGKESACNMEDLGSIPGLGRSPGEGNIYPLQYSGLENFMDQSRTRLSDFHFSCII